MITVTGQVAAVLDGIDQDVDIRVTLGLSVGPYTDFSDCARSLSLSMQNGTDLPTEVRDIVGFSSAGGTLVLSGSVDPGKDDTKTVAWLLNPDEPASPLYRMPVKGTPVTVDLGWNVYGQGFQWVRKFTGSIASYTLEHDTGTATLNIVDRSVDYDTTPFVPSVAPSVRYNAGLTTAFAMDAVIRSGGRASSWPATRPQCILAVGFVSSLVAEVGQLDTSTYAQPVPSYVPGAYAPGLAGFAAQSQTTAFRSNLWRLAAAPTSDVYIEFIATGFGLDSGNCGATVGPLDAGPFTSNSVRGITVNGTDYGPVELQLDGTTVASIPGPFGTGPHRIAARVNYSGGMFTGTLWIDTATATFSTAPRDATQVTWAAPSAATHATVTNSGRGAFNGLQVTTETNATPGIFTPAAILDVSLNPLTVVPEIPVGPKGSDILQTMAAAELGYARFDEQGVFRFTNRRSIGQAGIARQITGATALKPGMSTTVGAETRYNHVQVPYTEWVQGVPTAVYTLDTVKIINAYTTLTWTQTLPNLAANINQTVGLLPNGRNPTDGGSYYRASADPNGVRAHPGVTITITVISSGTVRISVNNRQNQTAYLTTPATYTDFPAGSAASGLWIGGTPLTPGDTAGTDSIYRDGMLPALAVSANEYRQNHMAAQDVGDYLLAQLAVAIRDFTGVSIIPDPRLQLPDKVRITDPDRSRIDEYAQMWGWAFDAQFPPPGQTGGRWDMTLDLRALAPPAGWIAGIPGRSEAGTTTYAYP